MSSDTTRRRPQVVLIGLGAHASHVYLPWLAAHRSRAELVAVVDVMGSSARVRRTLEDAGLGATCIIEVEPGSGNDGLPVLAAPVQARLDDWLATSRCVAAIVSTEPLAHAAYTTWALSNGLSVLSDKPIVTRRDISTSVEAVAAARRDFEHVLASYVDARDRNPGIQFVVSTHRRFHPGFHLARDAVREVFEATGCPITSVDAELADGEFRLPRELLEQDYHPLNQGYGCLSHSGYHVVDTFSWMTAAAESPARAPDEVKVFAAATRPRDVVGQLPLSDLERLFPHDDLAEHEAAEHEIAHGPPDLGEHDAALLVRLMSRGKVNTLGKLSITHQSVSSRAWASSSGRNLYRGNGRVRQESWTLHQGPLQTIRIISAQSDKADEDGKDGRWDMGGRDHFEVHVFRNARINPSWTRLRSYSIDDLVPDCVDDQTASHQDVAKRRLVDSFITGLSGDGAPETMSDIVDHRRGHTIWELANESLARQANGLSGDISQPLG